MSVLLDTGVLFATLNKRDERHQEAQRLLAEVMAGRWGDAVTTDLVAAESFTLLQRRRAPAHAVQRLEAFLGIGSDSGWLAVWPTPLEAFAGICALFQRHYDDGLSFTDCSLLWHMEVGGFDRLATFDRGFDGLAAVLPAPPAQA